MPTIWLLHGFNVSDAGERSISKLAPFFRSYESVDTFGYGWVGPFRVRSRNQAAVPELAQLLEPGDVLVGHSNGALISWDVAGIYSRLGAVVCINPAMRRDAPWPDGLPVLCLHNRHDYAVMAGRLWADKLWGGAGWGAAGRYGFQCGDVTNWETSHAAFRRPVRGHSGVFTEAGYWGRAIDRWLAEFARSFDESGNPRMNNPKVV